MLVLHFLLFAKSLIAQTPTDAIMMQQREFCFAGIYNYGSWNQYWEGSTLRKNETVHVLERTMLLPMVAIGIHNQVNLIVAAPYVKTESKEPNGGKFAGAQGFQDISIALKSQFLNKQIGSGRLAFLNTISFSTPMTNYLSDYRPYSIGFGAYELGLRGILHYQLDKGPYARTSIAHLWRGQTEAERDYYYNNGSYYTALMDVPNAWNIQAVLGTWLLDYSLKVEANYTSLISTSGDDIRKYNAGQPTNKTESGQIGITAQFYFQKVKGLGVLAQFSETISGRNVGKTTLFGAGFTYQFKL